MDFIRAIIVLIFFIIVLFSVSAESGVSENHTIAEIVNDVWRLTSLYFLDYHYH
jgi:hypothetical protein